MDTVLSKLMQTLQSLFLTFLFGNTLARKHNFWIICLTFKVVNCKLGTSNVETKAKPVGLNKHSISGLDGDTSGQLERYTSKRND
jgi:hypothetical protein